MIPTNTSMSSNNTSSNIHLRIENRMKCFIELARECIINNIEEEIEKVNDPDLKNAFRNKLTEVLESDILITRPKSVVILSAPKILTEPVNIRHTPLKLKNMSNSVYRKFCSNIATMSGYAPDFSDAPFNNLSRNTRVYEAIKRLYNSGKITQEIIDQMVAEVEVE